MSCLNCRLDQSCPNTSRVFSFKQRTCRVAVFYIPKNGLVEETIVFQHGKKVKLSKTTRSGCTTELAFPYENNSSYREVLM